MIIKSATSKQNPIILDSYAVKNNTPMQADFSNMNQDTIVPVSKPPQPTTSKSVTDYNESPNLTL